MTPEVVQEMSAGRIAAGIRGFLDYNNMKLSGKILTRHLSTWAEDLPFNSVSAELEQIHCYDPARALYVFLLENDQRRHLAHHPEQIDLVRFESIEPFYDPEVLSIVCSLPVTFCLRHHMYHKWLERLPREVLSVPWQAYPGHEECPIPTPEGLFSQWEVPRKSANRLSMLQASMRRTFRRLARHGRDRNVMRTHMVVAADLLYGLGLRDTYHLLHQVELLERALDRCDGYVEMPLDH
jgi:asparagine synthase (glutamine-hydrolysing)